MPVIDGDSPKSDQQIELTRLARVHRGRDFSVCRIPSWPEDRWALYCHEKFVGYLACSFDSALKILLLPEADFTVLFPSWKHPWSQQRSR
jgi:hypothetical protein